MKHFIFWKSDEDDDNMVLVGYSNYWNQFNGQYGNSCNQSALTSLLSSGQYQVIKISDPQEIDKEYMGYISRWLKTLTFDLYQKRISQDLAYMSREQLVNWLSKINYNEKSSLNSSFSTEKSYMTNESEVNSDKTEIPRASWIKWLFQG